jgi:hypothetical protein
LRRPTTLPVRARRLPLYVLAAAEADRAHQRAQGRLRPRPLG